MLVLWKCINIDLYDQASMKTYQRWLIFSENSVTLETFLSKIINLWKLIIVGDFSTKTHQLWWLFYKKFISVDNSSIKTHQHWWLFYKNSSTLNTFLRKLFLWKCIKVDVDFMKTHESSWVLYDPASTKTYQRWWIFSENSVRLTTFL